MRVMNTNFFGSVNVTNAILPHMRGRREGQIVFIGSRSVFRNQITVRVLPTQHAKSHSYTGI
jgi:NADP-dependent 3-hydroxy acid dehydrogenase YdfG